MEDVAQLLAPSKSVQDLNQGSGASHIENGLPASVNLVHTVPPRPVRRFPFSDSRPCQVYIQDEPTYCSLDCVRGVRAEERLLLKLRQVSRVHQRPRG